MSRASSWFGWQAGSRFFPVLLAGMLVTGGPAWGGELRGLVIGIDEYPRLGEGARLEGAVNDAKDIAEVLSQSGAADVVLLVDGEAMKAQIASAWRDLLSRSEPGDTVVLSYAGHGSQEPEPPGRKGEPDGKNENFILGGYASEAPHNGERIVDDEVFEWLKSADDKGVRVVFIADSCHSGTMYRSATAKGVRFRNVNIPDIADDQLILPPPAFADTTPDDFQSVTFIGATEESRLVPEVNIEGKARGALSYSFARAVEGSADRDGDGQITQAELVNFLVPKVHALVEGQQSPQVLPVRAGGEALIVGQRAPAEKPAASPADLLKVAITGGQSKALDGMPGVNLIEDAAQSDLVWDVGTGLVEHPIGGRVAEEVDEKSIVPVVSKWATLKWLQAHANGAPGQFILHSGNQRYKPASEISLSFEGAELPYLTLFNLAPDGRVEFFVEPFEVNIDWRGRKAEWKFRPDKPPFGSEHMVAVLTEKPLSDLHNALKSMSTADRAVGLRNLVEAVLGVRRFQLGVIGIYTGEGG